jgi:hypothetical protein
VYELASGPGDDPFVTVALAGLFDSKEAAVQALEGAGWIAYDSEKAVWKAPSKRWLQAEILPIGGSLPAG